MKKTSNLIYFLVTFLFFFGTNFYLSNLIVQKVTSDLGSSISQSGNIINIVFVKNTGAAFSIMQDSTNILILLSIVSLLGIFYFTFKNISSLRMKELLFISFLTSGILGNLYERISYGYVRDFFDLTFINFPIFNISDVFINIGVLGIIVLILLTKKPIKFL